MAVLDDVQNMILLQIGNAVIVTGGLPGDTNTKIWAGKEPATVQPESEYRVEYVTSDGEPRTGRGSWGLITHRWRVVWTQAKHRPQSPTSDTSSAAAMGGLVNLFNGRAKTPRADVPRDCIQLVARAEGATTFEADRQRATVVIEALCREAVAA